MNPATHASVRRFVSDSDYEAAYCCLLDSLACGLRALQHTACMNMIGPVVPGATMTGGARVPGTSYDLDPVQAAFSIGTMVHWLDCNDVMLAAAWGHPSDALGGLLAVADYVSRKAIAEGRQPFIVRDVLDAMLQAHSIQRIAALEHGDDFGVGERESVVRLATAAVVTSLLGGTGGQVVNAVSSARSDGKPSPRVNGHPHGSGWRSRWALGDATSRGVRLALLAVNGEQESLVPTSTDAAIGRVLSAEDNPGWITIQGIEMKEASARTRERFEASIAAHFPPSQANKIRVLFADQPRLTATPVHEFLSLLVKN